MNEFPRKRDRAVKRECVSVRLKNVCVRERGVMCVEWREKKMGRGGWCNAVGNS